MIKQTVMVSINMPTALDTRATGLTTSNTVKARKLGSMAVNTMATMLSLRRKVEEPTHGLMETNTLETGEKMPSTE